MINKSSPTPTSTHDGEEQAVLRELQKIFTRDKPDLDQLAELKAVSAGVIRDAALSRCLACGDLWVLVGNSEV